MPPPVHVNTSSADLFPDWQLFFYLLLTDLHRAPRCYFYTAENCYSFSDEHHPSIVPRQNPVDA